MILNPFFLATVHCSIASVPLTWTHTQSQKMATYDRPAVLAEVRLAIWRRRRGRGFAHGSSIIRVSKVFSRLNWHVIRRPTRADEVSQLVHKSPRRGGGRRSNDHVSDWWFRNKKIKNRVSWSSPVHHVRPAFCCKFSYRPSHRRHFSFSLMKSEQLQSTVHVPCGFGSNKKVVMQWIRRELLIIKSSIWACAFR